MNNDTGIEIVNILICNDGFPCCECCHFLQNKFLINDIMNNKVTIIVIQQTIMIAMYTTLADDMWSM